ncbi:MAG: AEC family transporter [Oscillospiraceae bacterium]|nr:AEC family transporter [Oscillospiraceae bacterium]
MLNDAFTIFKQVVTMFLMIGVGYLLMRLKLITARGAKQMTNLLLMVVVPCIIISEITSQQFDSSKVYSILIAAACAIGTQTLFIFMSKPIFKREKEVFRCSLIYSNCGFMALPLTTAILGTEGVLYGVVYLVVFNIFMWTHGVFIMSGDKKEISVRKALLSPGVMGTAIALPFFLLSNIIPAEFHGIALPAANAVRYIAGLNTPLAMIVIGTFMVKVDFAAMVKDSRLYLQAFLRLLIFPSAALALMYLAGIEGIIVKAIIIAACAPTAANVSLFAARYGRNTVLAGEITGLTTMLSVLTMPLMIAATTINS